MQDKYGEHVDFLTVYIKEAHPEDEWQVTSNEKEDVCYAQPTTIGQRVGIANDFVKRFEYSLPLLVDTMDNAAEEAYAAWPERLYIVDATGTIVYKGGMGPFEFNPEEVEEWLAERYSDPPEAIAQKITQLAR